MISSIIASLMILDKLSVIVGLGIGMLIGPLAYQKFVEVFDRRYNDGRN